VFSLPSRLSRLHRCAVSAALLLVASVVPSGNAAAQDDVVTRIALPQGRSYPITTANPITKVTVATPEIADAVVVGERDLVINAKAPGETDVILWVTGEARRHYRVQVRAAADRNSVLLSVRVAEVRKDLLRELGISGLSREGNARVGGGLFRSDEPFNRETGEITLPPDTRFATLLTDIGTKNFLAFIDAEQQKGRARLLAEPNLLAGDRDSASFLAGGEFPVPIAQPGQNGTFVITIQFREFGIRLNFVPEIVSDSLIKLFVRPEVSSLDYTNAVNISGFRIPALRTRRVTTTVDVKRSQSLIISGLMNEERERLRTGVPFLSDIPVLGALFGSSAWRDNQSELLVIVTPTIVNPLSPPPGSILRIVPDTAMPAREAIEKRLPPRITPGRP
jgi:pilus assembly protein CpaC